MRERQAGIIVLFVVIFISFMIGLQFGKTGTINILPAINLGIYAAFIGVIIWDKP